MLRILNRWFRKSRTVNNEPINKVSLIVIILVDIFILINVFTGLADISQWYINPSLAYPCYSEWQNYQVQTIPDKDYQIIRDTLFYRQEQSISFQKSYQENEIGHLGNVSPTCLRYADYKDKVNVLPNQQILTKITKNQTEIDALKRTNANVRAQYDSTLLEKIADQPREQSINQVAAEKAKQTIDQNNQKIAEIEKEVTKAKTELLAKPESLSFIAFLNESISFREVESVYRQAAFWYPSIQFVLQTLFLLPLILIALLVHKVAQSKQYGLISLISWHLLVIFLIPLILKIFEFLQVGIIFQFLRNILQALFGGLLFLISYVYILLVPVFGFGIIKFFQKVVFNPKVQAAKRFQKSCCVNCGKKIREHDIYCTHCGYNQYTECPNCHNSTYQGLSFCTHCGHPQDAHS
ncbi:hypothetical protein [Pseudanabaena mucicola]|uniref:Zinc ribbon domain-containing protein n=1 Tax=Pseudanabaena mucicola FACHB-723 TaxID=2692860 RepID=A0ABR7ZXZ8_9CYAN|nr:hypothetical protein [Pseudanabaena mucicola]MBD2188654.1 hypothetical protein [Pseudanabaena mucicola FACHB-723]